jgi:hypothetical protein
LKGGDVGVRGRVSHVTRRGDVRRKKWGEREEEEEERRRKKKKKVREKVLRE